MDKLQDKLLKLKETLEKGMKNGGIGGEGSVKAGAKLPSVSKPKAPGSTNSATPSVGQAPSSKKNPVKQAQQIQNPDIKDQKMKEAQASMKGPEIVKYDSNGQWSVEKAYEDRVTTKPGVSEMGIEARRGTGKDSLETGYSRVTDAKTHKDKAREMARQNVKETQSIKPKLPKSVDKSGYKGYTESDNARRKANNLSEETGIHSMNRIKQYGGSGADAAGKEAAQMKAKSKKNPVKEYSKEEIDALNREKGLKKEDQETVKFEANGQWSVEKRCWDGYEPTPGKKPYEDDSCRPVKKSEDEIEKKDWSPKSKHKSDKGGLTEAGRKSYNKATGGNLKAPQPEGGPRKKSFCARNKGQIDEHNIDCKKNPEKRACKARKRWKC